jgi:YebC/PmpR family DNA-binding regulatory protein
MSGHSKWSKVKHQKATTDVVKAKNFTKASRALMVAVTEGGGITDPNSNFRLRLAIEKARDVNMPKDTIERAIAKAKGEGSVAIELLLYEAYGPHGVPLLIEATTENRQRTASQIKNILDRNGGVLAAQGAVSYQFAHTGVIVIDPQPGKSEDDILNLALECGASDVHFFDDAVELYTEPQQLEAVKVQVEKAGISVNNSELIFRPTMPQVSVDEKVIDAINQFVDVVSELDDVQKVYTNIVS